ncbi:hypothetical protein Tco_0874543 [Tanacetum coccineum]|uniref:Uncharacterized protein n=1 Tax=Tanacetum coccineum TaxID=301880 RepID=A0ABQ5BPX4_9ASTR
MSSSSSSSHATVTYTSVSSDDDLPSWGIPLMEAYELEAPLSPVYAPPIKDNPEEDPEMDPVDYLSDKEEEEPLALADSASPVLDYAPSSEETEPFETDVTPPPPECRTAPTPPSPSPLSPLSSPLPRIPSPPLLLPSPTCMDIILEVDIPLRKRARFAAPSQRFEIGESSAAIAARQHGSTLARGTELDFMIALNEVKEVVTDIAARHRQDSEEFYTLHQDAQDDRAVL